MRVGHSGGHVGSGHRGEGFRRSRRTNGPLRVAVGVLAFVAAGCTPDPGGPGGTTTTTTSTTTTTATTTTTIVDPGNDPPIVTSFAAAKTSGPAPLTTALQWAVTDPNLDPLTCWLDLDNNGTNELTINACTSSSIRSATFGTPGSPTIKLSVSDGIAPPVTATIVVTVGAASADQFAITLRLNGAMTPSQSAAFTTAAARWAQLVRTGLSNVSLTIAANDCDTGAPAFSGVIDDLLIDATIAPIDGPGGVLGQAGPCYTRSSAPGLPVYGVMQFDSADVANLETAGQFNAVILHEMGHVLGIGTVWASPNLIGAGTADPRFTGVTTRGALQSIGGVGDIAVENSGGSGTRDSHWRESVFNSELMTGYLDDGVTPLSAITVASLADIGYGVDLGAADPYGLPGLLREPAGSGLQLNTRLIFPTPIG